jgi:hypothetical protein
MIITALVIVAALIGVLTYRFWQNTKPVVPPPAPVEDTALPRVHRPGTAG